MVRRVHLVVVVHPVARAVREVPVLAVQQEVLVQQEVQVVLVVRVVMEQWVSLD